MKKMLVVVLVVAIALIGASAALAGVVGSKHDIRTLATDSTALLAAGAEVCVYCHTPHAANTTVNNLLWNLSFGTDATAFAPYTSDTSTVAQGSSISKVTKLCMSCHDGTQAVFTASNKPNYNGYVTALTGDSGVTAAGMIIGAPLLTADFSNDHPVGFDYATAVSYNPAGEYQTTLPVTLPLINGDMECSTCHNVHGGVANTAFLRITNANSLLCTTCHITK